MSDPTIAALLRVTDAAEWTLRRGFPGDADRAEHELSAACAEARDVLAALGDKHEAAPRTGTQEPPR